MHHSVVCANVTLQKELFTHIFFAIYFNGHNSIFRNELIVEELEVMNCKKKSQYQQKISNSKFSDWLINKVEHSVKGSEKIISRIWLKHGQKIV